MSSNSNYHYQCSELNRLIEDGHIFGHDKNRNARPFKSINGLNVAITVFLKIPLLNPVGEKEPFIGYEMKRCIDCGKELIINE